MAKPVLFPPARFGRRLLRGSWALLAAAVAMLSRSSLDPWLGDAVPFIVALPAVFFLGWFAGNAAATVATVGCAAWLVLLSSPPNLSHPIVWRSVLYFLPSALMLGFLGSRLRRNAKQDDAALRTRWGKGVGWLWAATLLGGAVPLAMFAAAAVNLYQHALAEANLRVERAARIGEEHALKVFETNIALINRTLDAMGDEADATLLEREGALHEKLKRMTASLTQLQGIFIIGANGTMIATNRVFPAPHQLDFSDRRAFVHHRAGGPSPYFSEVLTSRTTGEPFFDMSVRRSRADGSFSGTVSTSLSPGYFADFYREISSGMSALGISLKRADGVLLAGWPVSPLPTGGSAAGTSATVSTSAADSPKSSLEARRPLGGYPVFVSAQMDRRAALAPWYDQMLLMLAITFPTAAGLSYIGWVALQRTRHAIAVAEALRVETESRKQVEDSLRQSQKMMTVGQLTGGIAHDFNNLLQVVSSNLHLIERDEGVNASIARRVAHAHGAVKRGAKLASQLLAFGRRQPLEPKVMNVGKLVLGMEDLLSRALGGAVEVEAVVSGSVWNAHVDPGQVENAILNLALNARDAMRGAGKLTIEVSNAMLDEAYAQQQQEVKSGQYVLVAVSDTGTGMTAAVAAQAFDPFFTTKPAGTGTGLGLSMVYGFMKQSGGHVKIYSEPGHGSTLKLYFPRSLDSEQATTQRPPPAEAAGGSESILVVEDDAAVRDTAVEMLRALGYAVLHADSAQAAMAIIDSGAHIDLLFTDVVMPGEMRSTELARLAVERLPKLAVLYTSGYTQNAIVHGGRLDAGVDLLSKPYSAQALAERVRASLAKGRSEANSVTANKAVAPAENGLAGRRHASVLLVEDDDLIRASTAEMLRALGHKVIEARSAEEAMVLLGDATLDVLMADIGLPGMSGDVFAAQVRSIRPSIVVIFATGAGNIHHDAADPAGPLLLRKPYDMASIEIVMRQALARR